MKDRDYLGDWEFGDLTAETFVVGDGTNQTSFASDGLMTMEGTARVEQFVESLAITGRGGSAPTERTTESPYLSWTFNIGNDSHQSFEAPYQMDYGDACKIKIHWYTHLDQTDDEVQWQTTWNAVSEDSTEPINAGSTTDTSGDINCPTQWHIQETLIETIAANSIAQDDIIGIEIERVALSGAGTNPTNSSIHVLSIEFEYYMNKLGEATTLWEGSYFDDRSWEIFNQGSWDDANQEWDSTSEQLILRDIGSWNAGYRPTSMRIYYTGAGGLYFTVLDTGFELLYDSRPGGAPPYDYVSGTQFDISWAANDIWQLTMTSSAAFSVTGIEFLP